MENIKIYLDKDINQELIKSKKIAVIGFGSQGYGQAMNLKDSGCDVVLGLRLGGNSDKKAKQYGFKTMSIEEAVKQADIVQILIPDELQADVYEKQIKNNMHSGQYLMFSHGGHTVRSQYTEGKGVPCLIAVENDPSGNSKEVALSYASAIGAGRAGIIETTFKEETETDLFGEQAVICGGVSALMKAGFDVLVEAGYSKHMAYFEVLHEMKLIIDLVNQGGISDMHYSISNTAEYGDLTRGPRVIGEASKNAMREILKEIQSGKFADEFTTEMKTGCKNFNKLREENSNHPVEKIGEQIRASFVWGNENKLINRDKN